MAKVQAHCSATCTAPRTAPNAAIPRTRWWAINTKTGSLAPSAGHARAQSNKVSAS
jgi:hypothetical protein